MLTCTRRSLVLVHGLGGDPIDTWTCKTVSPSVFWPRDLLSKKQPRTRVLSFGYSASIYENTSIATIRDNARAMLDHLSCLRDEGGEDRPIVFLGHCLGGLIVEQVSHTVIGCI